MSKTAIYVTIEDNIRPFVKVYNYCLANKIDDYEIFIDKVLSATDIENRPALNRLKEKVCNKKINSIIIENFDNISKSPKFNNDLIEFITSKNCTMKDINNLNMESILQIYKFTQEMYSKEYKNKLKHNKNKKEEELER